MQNAKISTYDEYCKLFNSEEGKKIAYILFSLQSWIIDVDNIRLKDDTISFSLDQFLNRETHSASLTDDFLTWIINNSFEAISFLSKHMKEDILRENIKMPFFKAREFNSQCFNWLSRQAGDNVKEKIVNSSKNVLAVNRRMTFDTSENRLYISLLRELLIYECYKEQNFNKHNISEREQEASELFQKILTNPEYADIGKWGNTLPNNTLLADKNYRQIWNAWCTLKNLDKNIRDLSLKLYEKEALSYYFDLLTLLSKYYKFPQCPLVYDVEKMDIQVLNPFKLFGVRDNNDICYIEQKENKIEIKCQQKKIAVIFDGKKIHFYNDNEYLEFENNISVRKNLLIILKNKVIKNASEIPVIKSEVKNEESVCLDIYSIKPTYINKKNMIETIPGLLLAQCFKISQEEHFISCDSSRALFYGVKTYSFINSIANAYLNELIFLTHLLEKYYKSDSTTIVIPDKFDVFQLSNVIKSVKLISKTVNTIPRSIGSVFYYSCFNKNISHNDVFIIADYVDNDISLTLINGETNHQVCNDIQHYNGVVWSRHPTKVYSAKEDLDEYFKMNNLSPILEYYLNIFGINGVKDELRHIPIIQDDKTPYLIDEITYKCLSNFHIGLDSYLNDFLEMNKYLIKNKKLHIISLSQCIRYSGKDDFEYHSIENSLKGCNRYRSLQKETSEQLWHDYLPSLSIKLLYGTFDLIKEASVQPKVNEMQSIPISDTFTLTKGKKEYRFSLIQDDSNQSLRYAAIVRNQVFPLPKDVVCSLNLTYRYGSEQPFSLIFTPTSKDDKKIFNEAKVEWVKLQDKDYISTLIPKMPSTKNWDTVLNDPSIMELVKKVCSYKTISLGSKNKRIFGETGNQIYLWNAEIDNKLVEIRIRENNWKFSRLGDIDQISFTISEINKKRYILRENFNWKLGNNNTYSTVSTINLDGENAKLLIFQTNFIDDTKFSTKLNTISYSLSKKTQRNKIEIEDIRNLKWKENKHSFYTIYNAKIDNSVLPVLIRLTKEDFNKMSTNYISFFVKKPDRCEVEFDSDTWGVDRNGFKFCKKMIPFENREIEVFFHQNYFLNDEYFYGGEGVRKVSFDLIETYDSKNQKKSYSADNIYIINKNIDIEYEYVATRIEDLRTYRAVNIHPGENLKTLYKATNILSGDRPKLRANEIKNILSGNKSIYDPNCPRDFRDAIEKALKLIFNDFRCEKIDSEKIRILKIITLFGCDIGKPYYDFILNLIRSNQKEFIIDYIGYSLGDLSTPEQKELFSEVKELSKNKFLEIFSKAIWWNELFIFNLDTNWMLKYFEECITLVVAKEKKGYLHDIVILLEIILGAFRLRHLNDPEISKRLSLANEKVVLLYEVIEKLIKRGIKIKSSLKLDIKDKGQYSEIPDLLYALLIYITGNEGDEGIIISSNIEHDDEDDDEEDDEGDDE